MFINDQFKIKCSISEEQFVDKEIAEAMTNSMYAEGVREIRKKKHFKANRGISYREAEVTPPELLNKLINGHTICQLFNPIFRRKDGTFASTQKKYETFVSADYIPVDIDHTDCKTPEEFIGKLRYKPTLYYTSYNNYIDGKGLRLRLIYIVMETITDIYLYRFSATLLNNIINSDIGKNCIDLCNLQASQYFNGTCVYNENLNVEYGITNIIYSLKDFGVTEANFYEYIKKNAGYPKNDSKNIEREEHFIRLLNNTTDDRHHYVYSKAQNQYFMKEIPYHWFLKKVIPYFRFPVLNSQKFDRGLLFNLEIPVVKSNVNDSKVNVEYKMERTVGLSEIQDSKLRLTVEDFKSENSGFETELPELDDEVKFEITKIYEPDSSELSPVDSLNSQNLNLQNVDSLNSQNETKIQEIGNSNSQKNKNSIPTINDRFPKKDGCLFDIDAKCNEIIDINTILYDWDHTSVDEFKKSKEWNNARDSVKYVYRIENVWIDDLYQYVDDNYFALFYHNEPLVDGCKRRKSLYTNMCLRRVMCPDITEIEIVVNTLIDIMKFYDNSDGVLNSNFIRRNVKNAFSMSIEDIEEKYKDTIDYLKEQTRPKNRIIFKSQKVKTQENIFKIIDKMYDVNKSVTENLMIINEEYEYKISLRHLNNYRHSRGISNVNIVSDEKLIELLDITLSIRKNLEFLKDNDIKCSKDRIAKLLNWKKNSCDDKNSVVEEPYVEYGTTSDSDDILDTPLWIAIDQYGLDIRRDGVYVDDILASLWNIDNDDWYEEERLFSYNYPLITGS